MIRGLSRKVGGFTILETIIVLTISSMIIASAMLLFRTRIPRAQFANSVNDLAIFFRDTYSHVSTGYYPNTGYSCKSDLATSFKPELSPGGGGLGTNQDCIYLGQAVGVNDSEKDKLNSFTIFGSRMEDADKLAINLNGTHPQVSNPYGVDSYKTGYGLSVEKIKSGTNQYTGLAYATTFGTSAGVDGQPVGTSQVELRPLNLNGGAMAVGSFESEFNSGWLTSSTPNPAEGVLICLKSGTTDQYATILLGKGGNASSVETEILDNLAWNTKCS